MNGINSVKSYEYSFLVKNGAKKVGWVPHLYILLKE